MAAIIVQFVVLYLILVHESITGLTPEGCPDGWKKSPSLEYCYKRFVRSTTARGAMKECEALDAKLVSIWNEDEFNFIKSHVWEGDLAAFSWTGLEGSDRKVWQWQDGSAADNRYTKPNTTPPSSAYCGALYGAGNWYQYPMYALACDSVYTASYICKMGSSVVYFREPPRDGPETMIGREAIFTRLWVPILTRLPPSDVWLDNRVVINEIECALHCSRTDICQGFTTRCKPSARPCDRHLCRPLLEV